MQKSSPAFGALAVSLPLVSLLGILQLLRATGDAEAGLGFWPSLTSSCAVTMVLYFITARVLARLGTDP